MMMMMYRSTLATFCLALTALYPSSVQAFSASPAAAKVPFTDTQLFEMAQTYLNSNGFYGPVNPDAIADDYVFRGGVVGPLNKEDYCTTMYKLGIYRTFDLESNAFGFCVDPDDPLTVRFFIRYTGKQVIPWTVEGTPYNIPVSKEPIQGPTEPFVMQFNAEGKVRLFSIGAPMFFGNAKPATTGKTGAVLGLFGHVGETVAVESALNPRLRQFSNAMADIMPDGIKPPRTASKPEDVPAWWTE